MPGPASELRFGMDLANEELLQCGSSVFLKDPYVEGLILHLSTYVDVGDTSDMAGVEGSG